MKGQSGPGGGGAPRVMLPAALGSLGWAAGGVWSWGSPGRPGKEAGEGADMLRRAALLKDTAESRAGGDTRV